jgi:hypothetical protein
MPGQIRSVRVFLALLYCSLSLSLFFSILLQGTPTSFQGGRILYSQRTDSSSLRNVKVVNIPVTLGNMIGDLT